MDAEGFVKAVIRQVHRGGSGPEGGQETDDLVAFLIGELWLLSTRPLPGIWATRPFGAYAVWATHRRITDWYRARYPGSRYRRSLSFVPLEADSKFGGEGDDGNRAADRSRMADEAVRRGDITSAAAERRIDVEALSDTGRQTLFLLAVPMAHDGLSTFQLAARTNGSEHPALRGVQTHRRAIVDGLLDGLRDELVAQGIAPTVVKPSY